MLLRAEGAGAFAELRAALGRAGLGFEDAGEQAVLIRASGGRLSEVTGVLGDRLPSGLVSRLCAALVRPGRELPEATEPLTELLRRTRHEWVREALDDSLFSVFQPILSRDGGLLGHEALVRARDAMNGEVVSAGRLAEASEALCLQHVLDQRARTTALRCAALHGIGGALVFINFLPNAIYDPEICLRTTFEAADACGLDRSCLVFEVVETEKIPDLDRLARILDYYRSRGAMTAVDDMGAGFSSMRYVHRLRPDYVKIDGAIVQAAPTDLAARARMAVILAGARSVGARVIAEGIETREQFETAFELGADHFQGYLFARPAAPPLLPNTAPFAAPWTVDRRAA